MKKLKELINEVNLDIDILGITDDSRKVEKGFLFVATKGFNEDHYLYVDDAIKKKAAFVVTDREIEKDFPHFVVEKNINDVYVEICRKFYDVDLGEFKFLGITGTDGKTTTASIIAQLLGWAYIGTNGVLVNGLEFSTNNTTPVVDELYKCLHIIKENGCDKVVMEVSSEALLHDRLKGFQFEEVGYTNITEDHLNVHKTLENYRECKFRLVKHLKTNAKCFINGDCENCQLLKYDNLYSYGFSDDCYFQIVDVKEDKDKVNFTIKSKDESYDIESPLLGNYNIYNVTLAFLMCLDSVDSKELIDRIKHLKPIKGRREYLNFGQDFTLILDYAHTYNGIKNLIESCKNYEKIIVVTGAAGGREKEKRKLIGNFLLDNTDIVVFTMDDPRYESVDSIIDDMLEDSVKNNYYRIVDRKEAIRKAFSLADSKSVVLVIGKGRDNYMAIEDKKVYYSDYDTIKELLK